jgi:hypothetical protein
MRMHMHEAGVEGGWDLGSGIWVRLLQRSRQRDTDTGENRIGQDKIG